MAQSTSMEEFEALLNESFEMDTPEEGSVVKGKVIAIEAGQAIIDVGYKMEGRVDPRLHQQHPWMLGLGRTHLRAFFECSDVCSTDEDANSNRNCIRLTSYREIQVTLRAILK